MWSICVQFPSIPLHPSAILFACMAVNHVFIFQKVKRNFFILGQYQRARYSHVVIWRVMKCQSWRDNCENLCDHKCLLHVACYTLKKKNHLFAFFFFQKLTSSKAWKSTASNQHQTLGRGFIEPELLQRFRHLHLIPLTEIQALKPVISEQLLPRMEFVWYQHIYLFRPNSHFTWKTRCVIQMADLSQTYI